jgi:hypothetical protein
LGAGLQQFVLDGPDAPADVEERPALDALGLERLDQHPGSFHRAALAVLAQVAHRPRLVKLVFDTDTLRTGHVVACRMVVGRSYRGARFSVDAGHGSLVIGFFPTTDAS